MKYLIILFYILIIIFTSNPISALSIYNVRCDDKGQLTLLLGNLDRPSIHTEDIVIQYIDKNTNLTGKWDSSRITQNQYTLFVSDTDSLVEYGEYEFNIIFLNPVTKLYDNITFRAKCPGISFSCGLLPIEIKECTNENDNFKAYLRIPGAYPSANPDAIPIIPENILRYDFYTTNQYEDIDGRYSRHGALPKGALLKKLSNREYLLEYNFEENNEVEAFRIFYDTEQIDYRIYNECTSGYIKNLIASKRCKTIDKTEPQEIKVEASESEQTKPTQVIQPSPVIIQESKPDYKPFIIIGISIIIAGIVVAYILRKRGG